MSREGDLLEGASQHYCVHANFSRLAMGLIWLRTQSWRTMTGQVLMLWFKERWPTVTFSKRKTDSVETSTLYIFSNLKKFFLNMQIQSLLIYWSSACQDKKQTNKQQLLTCLKGQCGFIYCVNIRKKRCVTECLNFRLQSTLAHCPACQASLQKNK